MEVLLEKNYMARKEERDEKYDLHQLRTEPWIPNQDERRVSTVLLSLESKAAVRSRRHRHCCCDRTDEVIGRYRTAVSVE